MFYLNTEEKFRPYEDQGIKLIRPFTQDFLIETVSNMFESKSIKEKSRLVPSVLIVKNPKELEHTILQLRDLSSEWSLENSFFNVVNSELLSMHTTDSTNSQNSPLSVEIEAGLNYFGAVVENLWSTLPDERRLVHVLQATQLPQDISLCLLLASFEAEQNILVVCQYPHTVSKVDHGVVTLLFEDDFSMSVKIKADE